MDVIIEFLINWGYAGIFLSAFLAGSVIPFSSEAVLAALVHPSTGLNSIICLVMASTGNLLGGLTCYGIGRLGRMDWLEKYFHMKSEKIMRMQIYLHKRSAFISFFTFLPVVGDVIAVSLGFLRSNLLIVSIGMFTGKLLRYIFVVTAAQGIFSFFG
jgi:membrane protein YqaA with SNARE-associated domain